MHYYIASYTGAGTDADPFRPATDVPGWAAIDLRPDCTQQAGRCLLALPVRQDPVGARYLGEDPDAGLSTAIKRRVEGDLGISLANATWRQIIPELLISHARTDGTRWRPLRASSARTRYEVWLGDLLWSMPVIAGGATITDDFNRANNADLGSSSGGWSWTEVVTDWSIVSNQANQVTGATNLFARAESDLASDDHYAQVTYSGSTTSTNRPGVLVRFAAAETTFYHYFTRYDVSSSAIQKYITGTPTSVQAGTDWGSLAPNDVLRLEVDGSTLTVKVNGTTRIGPSTDTSITGNLRTGMYAFTASSGNLIKYDLFEAGDLAAAGETDFVGMIPL